MSNTANLARSLDILEPDRKWNTQGLIVTRRTHPAAFAVNSPIPFCTIDNLTDSVLAHQTTGGDDRKFEVSNH